MTAADQWVILELSSKAEGEDPDIVRRSIAYAVKGADVFLPAAVTQIGEDRVIHYLVDGYAFIRHKHPENLYNRLENSKYVQKVLTKIVRGSSGRPQRQLAFVENSAIEKMRSQIQVETDQGIGIGDTVLITSGAYRQIQAKVIEEIPEEQKVQVQVLLRSKDSIITLPRSFLRLVTKAPKAPPLDRFSLLRDWFNTSHSLLTAPEPKSFRALRDQYTAYYRLQSWLSEIDNFAFLLNQSVTAVPDFRGARAKLAHLKKVNDWTMRLDQRSAFVRSFYSSLDTSSLKTLGGRVEVLDGLAQQWEMLVPLVRENVVDTPFSDIETSYFKWLTLQDMQESIDTLSNELAEIEQEMEDSVEVQNIVIDGFNLAYRCFYAPGMGDMRDTQQRHTGVLFGFLRSTASLLKRYPGARVHVVWDGSNRTRQSKYAGYKANRSSNFGTEEAGGEKWDQVAWLREVLPMLGVSQHYNPGEEADDAIATLLRGPLRGQRNIVLSSDRDLLQLVSETDHLLTPAQGKRRETLYDTATLSEEWGVGPSQIVTLRALLGDNSDNLPGVPTVPQKVLLGLVQLYGTIDGIFASNLAGLTKLRYQCLRDSEAQVRLNFDIMTLRDLPLTEIVPNPDQKAASARLTDVDVQAEPILTVFFGEHAG